MCQSSAAGFLSLTFSNFGLVPHEVRRARPRGQLRHWRQTLLRRVRSSRICLFVFRKEALCRTASCSARTESPKNTGTQQSVACRPWPNEDSRSVATHWATSISRNDKRTASSKQYFKRQRQQQVPQGASETQVELKPWSPTTT